MFLDGSLRKEGVGAGVQIISPNREFKVFYFKLTFECTNNVAEYESLLLVLNALKYLGAKKVQVLGDPELVINRVNDSYQTKHPRLRAYINEVWDMFGNYFTEHKIRVISRYENMLVDSLDIVAGKYKTPTASQRKYKVDIVNRPSTLDHSKYWQAFEDYMQIKIFFRVVW